MKRAYLSSDDSRLIRSVLRGYSGDSCLEIGLGNGGNLLELQKNFKIAVGTDIVLSATAVGECEIVLADRASCFRGSSFDLVAFNPPYLTSEGIDDPAVDGGKDGVDVPSAFLREAIRVVKPGGKIVMLLSGQNPTDRLEALCHEHGLRMTTVKSERLFYETISVYEIERKGR